MNRRDFLRCSGYAIAALGIDPELLIWQPGQMISVPGLLTPDVYDGFGPLNLAAWAQRTDPNGHLAQIVALLSQQNDILDTLHWKPDSFRQHTRIPYVEG